MEKLVRSKFVGNQDGSIMMSFALFLPVFILVMALSIDATQNYVVRSKIVAAQDAAAVAATVIPPEVLASRGTTRAEFAESVAALNIGDAGYFGSNIQIDFTEQGNEFTADSRVSRSQSYFSPVDADTNVRVELNSGRQTVVAFSDQTTPAPTLSALILDGSGSMSSNNKIGALRNSVKDFIDITFPADLVNPQSEISSILYDGGIKREFDFSMDVAALKAEVDRYNAGGSTCAKDALDRATEFFNAKVGDPTYDGFKKQIIIMTDGHMCGVANRCQTFRDQGFEIVGITLGSGANSGPVVACTGDADLVFHAPDGEQLTNIFRDIATSNVSSRIKF